MTSTASASTSTDHPQLHGLLAPGSRASTLLQMTQTFAAMHSSHFGSRAPHTDLPSQYSWPYSNQGFFGYILRVSSC